MEPYAAPGALAGPEGMLPVGIAGVGPTRRNPLMTWLLPMAVAVGGLLLSIALAFAVSPALMSLFGLFALGAGIWYLVTAIAMANEVKSVTRNPAFAWWPIFIPLYNYFWLWALVPQEVSKAKQMLGVQTPTRSIILYIFLWHYALAADINDMVR
jgi:hypothetical protein